MPGTLPALSAAQIDSFITDGFVRHRQRLPAPPGRPGPRYSMDGNRLRSGRSRDLDQAGHPPRAAIPSTPFREASNTAGPACRPMTSSSGTGRWLPPQGLGTFPVRFPSPDEPGDDGWHIDGSSCCRRRLQGLLQHPRQCHVEGPRAADAVPVLRCRGGRCADPYPDRLASRSRALSGSRWRCRAGRFAR